LKADGIIVAPSSEISNDLVPFIRSMAVNVCRNKMKLCFVNVSTCIDTSETYELVNWFIDSGDGVVFTQDAASDANLVKNVEILENISSELRQFENERESCIECEDNLSVLASIAVTSSINTIASAIIILSGNYSLTQFVYFHRPKCTVIPVSNDARVIRQLNIFNGTVPLFCNSENGE
jgi:pyruvate kinase